MVNNTMLMDPKNDRPKQHRLLKVTLQADVYMASLQHALSENFEVMGLLIGENNNNITNISAMVISKRSDKKKDRVEISTDQLLKASSEAERLSQELNRQMRVVGWYHSHPHITVCPSHVDIRTQKMYQMIDPEFIGLIFSVFSEDKSTKEQEVLLTCFQSEHEQSIEIPLEIVPTTNISINCLKTMIELPKILAQEEEEMNEDCKNHPDILISIHNNAVKTKALGHITDVLTRSLVQTMHGRLISNKNRIEYLEQQIYNFRKKNNL